MHRTPPRPFTPSSQDTLASSRYNEHLSVAVPPPDEALERSRFSPDSPTGCAFSLSKPAFLRFSPRSRPLDLEKGSVGDPNLRSSQPSLRDRFTRLLHDLLSSRRNDPSVQPVAPIVSPLNIRKPRPEGQCTCHIHPLSIHLQKRYTRALLSAFIVFLLYLFINVIFLNVHLFALLHVPPRLSSTTPPETAQMTTTTPWANSTQQCITQYTLNATNDPTGYPCSTCLPPLAAFCGLRSIWEDANQQGQAGLEAGGWVKDVKFCTWCGVRCDGDGSVSSLQLTFPAVPASLPTQFTNLTALESLEIIGNGNSPGMTFVNNEPLTLSAVLCGRPLQNCDLRGTGIRACGACLVD
ncbi:hypothetical protein BJV74DRAFT_871185 [Russula compacta]|nr:hypothetical protein BJV74DRAFT_871185 [Russula compacta]